MGTSPSHDPRSDQQLIADLNAGDASAFDALYHRHRDWVVRLARRFTGHDEDALDALQETFAYFLSRFPGFQLTARLTTFLYPAVRNISLALRRKRRRFAADPESLDELPAPPPPANPSSSRADLATLMTALPAHHREVLLMRFVDDMTLDEIAAALDIPLGTVKSRLHHAIATLRADPGARASLLANPPP